MSPHEFPMTDHLFHEGVVDTRHGPILYLDDVSVSFENSVSANLSVSNISINNC